MISITKLTGRTVVASCLPDVSPLSSPSGTGLSGAVEARLAERGMSAVVRSRSLVNERATKAPTAVVAQAPAYAFTTDGAALQQAWTDGGFAAGTPSAAEHHPMRAFRGLEPWRDPA